MAKKKKTLHRWIRNEIASYIFQVSFFTSRSFVDEAGKDFQKIRCKKHYDHTQPLSKACNRNKFKFLCMLPLNNNLAICSSLIPKKSFKRSGKKLLYLLDSCIYVSS